jgi:hypothetical protein
VCIFLVGNGFFCNRKKGLSLVQEEEEEGSDIVNSCEFLNVLSAVACAAASADPLQCSIVFAQ